MSTPARRRLMRDFKRVGILIKDIAAGGKVFVWRVCLVGFKKTLRLVLVALHQKTISCCGMQLFLDLLGPHLKMVC
ncbi:hypothetical protein Z043_100728 [Scleropages formosus]|uniref:Uncharacterized protein n=1 Tax=Scleropages formosus TaxID=113540 RepID=A0A0P7VCV4_SCLFO|nr:hypothetical protein Z043_100728 [Scleropages formosus]